MTHLSIVAFWLFGLFLLTASIGDEHLEEFIPSYDYYILEQEKLAEAQFTVRNHNQGRFRQVCYEELGCFSATGEFWHVVYRPISFLPNSPEEINTQFLLFTRQNPVAYQQLTYKNTATLEESYFDGSKPTFVIVHGYMDHFQSPWHWEMRRELLAYEDSNVIDVDWGSGNKPVYAQSAANTRVVGAQLAQLLNWIKGLGKLDPTKVHIIGHSLGAHVAGYAGERMDKLGRITGLDPAKPYFQNMGPVVRLDTTDALFVDTLVSNSQGYGMNDAVGHFNFYPNGGAIQPGCGFEQSLGGLVTGGAQDSSNIAGCSHSRSIELFIESINTKCSFDSHECESFESFMEGACQACGEAGVNCSRMGMKSILNTARFDPNNNVKFYLYTAGQRPFCAYSYAVTFQYEKQPNATDFLAHVNFQLKDEPTASRVRNPDGHDYRIPFGDNVNNRGIFQTEYKYGPVVQLIVNHRSAGRQTGQSSRRGITISKLVIAPFDTIDDNYGIKYCRVLVPGGENGRGERGEFTAKSDSCSTENFDA